jgi:hypothetical protein
MRPADAGDGMTLAEADGNRTRLTEMLGHNGFEDRAHHQTRYASTCTLSTIAGSSPVHRSRRGLLARDPDRV